MGKGASAREFPAPPRVAALAVSAHYDGRVVTVAQHHLRGLEQILRVRELRHVYRLRVDGHAEWPADDLSLEVAVLCHDEDAELVRQVEKVGADGIVGCAPSVKAEVEERVDAVALHAGGDGSAEPAEILMLRETLDLEREAVEDESLVCVEDGGAYADGHID
jgi:hypothetical protein